METAQSVINDALQEILVQANESDIEAIDFSTAARYMNRFMASLASQGVSLGYTKVTKASDPITIPDGAIEGLVFNLALRLAPQYDIEPTPYLRESARSGMQAMLDIAVYVPPTRMPSTMPLGSGNEYDDWNLYHFYPPESDELLTEQNGSVTLESGTNNVE